MIFSSITAKIHPPCIFSRHSSSSILWCCSVLLFFINASEHPPRALDIYLRFKNHGFPQGTFRIKNFTFNCFPTSSPFSQICIDHYGIVGRSLELLRVVADCPPNVINPPCRSREILRNFYSSISYPTWMSISCSKANIIIFPL